MDYISIKKLSVQHSVDFYQLKSYIEYLGIQIHNIEKVQSISIEDSELVSRFLQTYSRNEISYIISHQVQPFFEGTLLLDLRKKYNLNEKQFKTKCANANLEFKYIYSDSECQKFDDFMNKTSNLNRAELRDLKYVKEGWIPLRNVFAELGKKYEFCENTGTMILNYLNIEVYKPFHQLAFLKREQKNKLEDFLKKFNSSKERMLFFQEQTCMEKYGVSNPSLTEDAKAKISEKVKASCTDERQRKIEETKIKKYGSISIFHRYEYDSLYFHSSWELYYYIYQKEVLHNEITRGKVFEYTFNNRVHRYECDFTVNGENIEIKGNQFLDKDNDLFYPYKDYKNKKAKIMQEVWNAKQKCMKENNVRVISEKEIELIIEIVNKKYTKDYISLFRIDLEFPYPSLRRKSDYDIIRYFHKSIYHARRKKELSPYEAWKDKNLIKKSALNRLKYIKSCKPSDILQGFNVAKIAPKVSVFNPKLAEDLIKKYLNKNEIILDPFSGFSGRMIGAWRSGKAYIGYDVNKIHVEESNSIISYFNIQNCSVQQKDLLDTPKEAFDEKYALFTCPPYGGKEHWNKNNDEIEKTCDEWIDLCLQKYIGCIKYLFVIDKTEKYQDYIVETIENKSHFGRNQEYVILIQK